MRSERGVELRAWQFRNPAIGTRLWNTEPNSVSQNADSVKVGATFSDTNHRRDAIVSHISSFLKPLHVLPTVGVIGT
jgi:hypothetical protein